MELALTLFGALITLLTGLVALISREQDKRRRGRPNWTPLSRIALGLVLLGSFLAMASAIRQTTANRQASAGLHRQLQFLEGQNGKLEQRLEDLHEQNNTLTVTLRALRGAAVKQETVDRISLQVDAYSLPDRRGYNSLGRLYSRLTKRELLRSERFAVEFSFNYKPWNIYIAGVGDLAGEKWFYRIFAEGVNRKDFYETTPVPFPADKTFLVRLQLGPTEIDPFLAQRPMLVETLIRPSCTPQDFDPGFELGSFRVLRSGLLADKARAYDFACGLAVAPIAVPIPIPPAFLRMWMLRLDFNSRGLRNVLNPPAMESEITDPIARLSSWDIQDRYKPKDETWLAPVPDQWVEYADFMNSNVHHLLYGD